SKVLAACDGIDVIFHLGALPSVPRSIEEPLRSNENNVTGTLALLLAARDAGVKRLIYSSSSSVYGNQAAPVKTEDLCASPLSPYAVSKYAAEQYCRIAPAIFGLETVCLRYFNVFGPRQQPGSAYGAVIPRFIGSMVDGKPPVVEGNGTQSRDFTYVDNVVRANWLAAQADGVSGEVFNVACGRSWSLLQIIDELNRILKTSFKPTFVPERKGDVYSSLASVKKAEDLLGYAPVVSVPEGLEKTVAWTKANRAAS
ncbi:MAG: NAD-dependent epimerase/dehydratase family protein, partial [Chloroflexi bacterium]|nr:NAD-dependent epimerase/dehydratase family protein [Chloroflexota bacterium]